MHQYLTLSLFSYYYEISLVFFLGCEDIIIHFLQLVVYSISSPSLNGIISLISLSRKT